MNQELKNIANEFLYNYSPKLSRHELAISLRNFILNSIENIACIARKSLHIKEDSDELKNFIKNYDISLEYIEENLDDLHEGLSFILNNEFNYLFKNFQMIYNNKFNLNTEFVIDDSCCDICKFLVNANNDLTEHFLHDDCNSYLRLKPDVINTINIISHRFKLKNVPIKYKHLIESFLKLMITKYDDLVKKKYLLIYFNDSQEYDLDNYILFYKEKIPYQKFNLLTYREDLLRHLLDIKENEITKNLYLKNKGQFINFIAEKDSHSYLRESLISYILHPEILYLVDPQIHKYFAKESHIHDLRNI